MCKSIQARDSCPNPHRFGMPVGGWSVLQIAAICLIMAGCGGGGGASMIPLPVSLKADAGGPYAGIVSIPLHFDGSKSTGPGTQTLTYSWDFGDSSKGVGAAPTHTYTSAGNFTVGLTVTDVAGNLSTTATTAAVTLGVTANAGGPYNGKVGQTIAFDGSKSTGQPGRVLSFAWNFGDGGTGTGVGPTHEYSVAGNYEVTLTVSDTAGLSNTAMISAAIQASSSISPVSPPPSRVVMDSSGQLIVKDEIVVILLPTVADADAAISAIAISTGGITIGGIAQLLMYQVQYDVSDLGSLENIRSSVASMPGVQSAVLHYLADKALARVPDDLIYSSRNQTYHLSDSWTTVGPETQWHWVAINAPAGWDITTGDPSVPVGIVDADFDINQEDLTPNLTSYQGVQHPEGPDKDHGTHVAGLACAKGNNGIGVTGMAWNCSLRLYSYDSPVNSAVDPMLLAQAMMQAAIDGDRIVNMSFAVVDNNQCGTSGNSVTLAKVSAANAILGAPIQFAKNSKHDVLWVAAAGNECRDVAYQSPASLVAMFPDNMITVAASNLAGGLASYSNYGNLISVAAPGGENDHSSGQPLPGEAITSTFPSNDYSEEAGTSMAAPVVTGLAALVLSAHPGLSSVQIKQCIVSNAKTPLSGFAFKLINAPGAISCPTLLKVTKSGVGEGTITSAPAGLNCGATCSLSFPIATKVMLTATAAPGSSFAEWGGDCSAAGASTTVQVTMSGAKTCTAAFTLPDGFVSIAVAFAGPGTGAISSTPTGIFCLPTCSASFSAGTSLQLSANPSAGSIFVGWSGDCSGNTSTIQFTVTTRRTCVATFTTPDAPTLEQVDFPGTTAGTALFGINNSGDLVGSNAGQTLVRNGGNFSMLQPPGSTGSVGYGISESGMIAGTTTLASGLKSGFEFSGGSFSSIEFPNALETYVSGVNSSGQVVGGYRANAATTPQAFHAFSFKEGNFGTIDPPGAFGNSMGLGLNDAGQMVGSFASAINVGHGFLLKGALYTEIDFPGSSVTFAQGINSALDVVGYYLDTTQAAHGFLLQNGKFTSLDFPGALQTFATGLNDVGQIVGYFYGSDGTHGFVATRHDGGGVSPPAPVYDVADLGAFNATAITESGNVAGYLSCFCAVGDLYDANQAVFWTRDGGLVNLSTPTGWEYSGALGAQDVHFRRGDVSFSSTAVVGYAMSAGGSGNSHSPFAWSFRLQPGAPIALTGVLDQYWQSIASHAARAVGPGGLVVGDRGVDGVHCSGYIEYPYCFSQAFKYSLTDVNPVLVDLPTPLYSTSGGVNSQSVATGVNAEGDIVGWYVARVNLGHPVHGLLWSNAGVMRDLVGISGATNWSKANAISDYGRIVGGSSAPSGAWHATAWLADGSVVDLGTLGGTNSEALAVNASGVSVGWSDSVFGSRAFAESATMGMIDLSNVVAADSGWILSQGQGINSSGQIVGYGIHNGQKRAFLLTPHH